jgi:hypothetical protein
MGSVSRCWHVTFTQSLPRPDVYRLSRTFRGDYGTFVSGTSHILQVSAVAFLRAT